MQVVDKVMIFNFIINILCVHNSGVIFSIYESVRPFVQMILRWFTVSRAHVVYD